MNLKQTAVTIDKSTAIISMKLLSVASIAVLSVACSSSASNVNSPELLPADSMMSGPGLFSGKDGSYDALSKEKSEKLPAKTMSASVPATTSLEGKDLQQTSDLLEEKIKQSQRNTVELELLKRQVDAKLRTN